MDKGPTIPKSAGEDLQLTTTNKDGKKSIIPVPKGTPVTLHIGGLHYNRVFIGLRWYQATKTVVARYWEEPYAFKPDRFLKPYPKDAFLPFSGGARACIGRKCV